MVDEQEPAKRVVKRVVKKTVVRPASGAKPAQAPPRVRYGRPVASPATVRTRPLPKPGVPRQRIDLRSKAGSARERSADAWWVVADGVTGGARTVGTFATARARTVAGWRLPQLNVYLAAAITGAVVGIVAVILGIASLAIFDAVRGVSSGGGLWGGLTFAAIAVIAGFVGELLLRGFGSTSGRLTSVLAVVLMIVAMLGLFLDVVDTWAALPLLPVTGIAAFVLARWLIEIAESAPPEID